ncbi:uncharacterized protein LOC125199529 [Salvia hispanica]|uniref:uncharacterized protein LOC125199529 n=1 Tax=Salvia hispanica TaxID=49212 RepID=UPI0020090791|nr:uncharacterized protein LOC125199529 [Salvia hispanica]
MEEPMLTISSISQGINSFQPKFSVTMTNLIEFDSSPMISPIESMHRDSTLRKPFWFWHSPFPQLHFDVFGAFCWTIGGLELNRNWNLHQNGNLMFCTMISVAITLKNCHFITLYM